MGIYLGLGSNLGDRRSNLSRALEQLAARQLTVSRVSPVVESPALLPEDSPAEWNRPFLNLAAECETEASPDILRGWIEEIDEALGRVVGPRWSPRPIDLDILRGKAATVIGRKSDTLHIDNLPGCRNISNDTEPDRDS